MVDQRDILLSDDIVSDPARVRSILKRRAEDMLSDATEDLRVVRLVVPLPPADPFAWLKAQNMLPRLFWAGRNDASVTAAVGVADRCFGGADAGFHTLRSQLDRVMPHSDSHVRYFGGFRFDMDAEEAPEWSGFGTFTFTLPRFEYVVQDGRSVLACNLILPRDAGRLDAIRSEIDGLIFPFEELPVALPMPISRSDAPDREGWTENIEWALEAFRNSDLEKVVLARRARFGFSEPLDPFAVLKRLRAATANCFHFGFQYRDGEALVGATPERLFRRSGRRIWTEAVAGTRPRGETKDEDEQFLMDLLQSEKDQREHAYVRDSIRDALMPLSEAFYIDPVASEMELARGWHLVSRSRGVLKEDVHGSDVMAALHPTPAVGGFPTADALETIRKLEPFDRGWYAGPVGWIGSRGAEFAVALRCGLVRGETLSLYSGAGIVKGSEPTAEWNEIEQKISDFVKVFGLNKERREERKEKRERMMQ